MGLLVFFAAIGLLCAPLPLAAQATRVQDVVAVLPATALPERQAVAMAAEVHAIWAHAGVNVVWQTARPTEALADTIVVLVQIRDSLPFATSEASQPLGVVVRVNDRLQHTIFIARSAVERLVDASGVQRAGYPFDLFYGRFVGRIVAHELGHLLLDSSQHCASGLMRERFTGRDVLTSSHTRYTLCDGERAALTRR